MPAPPSPIRFTRSGRRPTRPKTGVKLNYQSIGSGGGIAQIQAKTVDFGASDMPLKPESSRRTVSPSFRPVIGGEVLVVNLPGIEPGQMSSRADIANIYLGKITKWNDPADRQAQSRVKLPDTEIAVVHRSDGSGTTFIFANYLSKVSPEWKTRSARARLSMAGRARRQGQ